MIKIIQVAGKSVDLSKKLLLIAGPCVIEDAELTFEIATFLKEVTAKYPIELIFKASFDKANRTSITSPRGVGLDKGMNILAQVKERYKIPVLSDVHTPEQVKEVINVLDVIQIPAFLCRQTDLIIEAAKSGKALNIKKGQFVAPDDVRHIVNKIVSTGNKNIILTERGTCFGYNNLVVDFRSFLIMKRFDYPVVYDATHSLQKPSASGTVSGGDRKFVIPMAIAACACGVNGIFMEVHPNPKKALSDKSTSIPLKKVDRILHDMISVRKALNYEK